MAEITKIRTMGTLEAYKPQGTHLNTLYQVEGTDTILYNGKPLSNEEIEKELENKANIEDLSNIIAEEVIDRDTFPEIDVLTREELKKDLFDDLWKSYFPIDGDVDHENKPQTPYFGNGIYLTYDEARAVVAQGTISSINANYRHANKNLKTFLPPSQTKGSVNYYFTFASNAKLLACRISSDEVISTYEITTLRNAFGNCTALHTVLGWIVLSSSFASDGFQGTFGNCNSLVNIKLYRVNQDVSFKDSSKLSAESIKFIINNRSSANKLFTITLHPTIYNKIVNQEDDYSDILDLAMSKNISIATA